jgi:hypothetical protein
MFCQRCRGLLVPEHFDDLREEIQHGDPPTRCINCGFVEDSVVRRNRLRAAASKSSRPRAVRKIPVVYLRSHAASYHSR